MTSLVIRPEAFDSPDVQRLVEDQSRELRARYTGPGAGAPLATDFVEPGGVFLLGSVDGEPVSCGGVRRLRGATAEIRRMYTVPSLRRHGYGRALLAEIERHALRLGYRAIRLETGDRQPDAVALYAAAGYGVIPCYGEFNDLDSLCMEKELGSAAGISVRCLETVAEIQAARDIWHRVWERSGEPPITTDLLRALAHSGNYVAGAFSGDEMVGALLGFYAGANGPDHLHSHILGVVSSTRGRGVGYALKLHQRDWVLQRGLLRITWTYDPLVRMNGYFNIAKLGAQGVEYAVNFYGDMPDAINVGDQSDRVLVDWELDSDRVRAALGERLSVADAVRPADAEVALEVGSDGLPVSRKTSGDHLLAQVPEDIVALRRTNPRAARAWRQALREVFAESLNRGLTVTGMNRAGWYEVERPS